MVTTAVYFTKISRVLLFRIAFILIRPFGATMGDVLNKSNEKGGLDFGTVGSSVVLASVLGVVILYVTIMQNRTTTEGMELADLQNDEE